MHISRLPFVEFQTNSYNKNTLIILFFILFIEKHVTKIPEKQKANGQKPSTMSMNSVMTMVIRHKFFKFLLFFYCCICPGFYIKLKVDDTSETDIEKSPAATKITFGLKLNARVHWLERKS